MLKCISQRLRCVNGDRLSQWRMANFNPYRIKTPEPIEIKFGTRDYELETTLQTKFSANLRKYVKYNTFWLFYLYNRPIFFGNSPVQVRPLNGFWRVMVQKTRFHARMCFWGIKMLKLTLNPFLCPQRSNFGRKRFTIATLTYKQPLIVIVAP